MNRRGVGAVIGSVIILTVIFTTVAGYFLFIERENQKVNESQKIRLEELKERSSEDLDITLKGDDDELKAKITNKSPLTTTIVYYILTSDDNNVIKNGTLDLTLESGDSESIELDLETQDSTIKVVTERGSVFVATCDDCEDEEDGEDESYQEIKLGPIKVSLDLKYSIFDDTLVWQDADHVPSNERVVFKLRIENIADENIWLTSNSALMLIQAGDSSSNPESWFLVKSVDSNGIDYLFDEREPYIRLSPEEEVMLYFAAKEPDDDDNNSDPPRMPPPSGKSWGVNLFLVGYFGEEQPNTDEPYTQTIPYTVIISE